MRHLYLLAAMLVLGCSHQPEAPEGNQPYVLVLGIAQDAGYPQLGCDKDCCKDAWSHEEERRYTTSLAIIDPVSNEWWLLECTPDIKEQLHLVKYQLASETTPIPNGILLTHGHMGHYTGLMHFGREAMGSEGVPVYVMPRMHEFLSTCGPWSQLVDLNNISLNQLQADQSVKLNDRINITPFIVPHRDEYTETVGYRIEGPNQSMLFIPDIDKWKKWDRDIVTEVSRVDIAFLDATFYANGEIAGRDMSEIPHPFIVESMETLGGHAAKIRFIHFNHTNPVMRLDSDERQEVLDAGFGIAEQLETYGL